MIKDITRVRLLNGGKMFPELRAKYGVVNTNDPIFIAAINRRVVEFIKKLEGTMPKEKLLEALSKFLQIEKENLLDLRIAEYGEWFKTYLESYTTGKLYDEEGMVSAYKENSKTIYRSPFYPEYNNRGEYNPRHWMNSLYPTVHVIDPKHAFKLYMLSLKDPEYVLIYSEDTDEHDSPSKDIYDILRRDKI